MVADTASAAETEALGARLAAVLEPGDVVTVAGELGAGKTTFVRGACRALGVRQAVSSPTYTTGNLARQVWYVRVGATNAGPSSSRQRSRSTGMCPPGAGWLGSPSGWSLR